MAIVNEPVTWIYYKGEPDPDDTPEKRQARAIAWRHRLYRGVFIHRHKWRKAKRGLSKRNFKHGEQWERHPRDSASTRRHKRVKMVLDIETDLSRPIPGQQVLASLRTADQTILLTKEQVLG
jgi:hypothetical protein